MKKQLYGIGIGLLAAVLLFSGVASADSMNKTIEVIYRNIELVVDGREVVPKDVNDNIVEPFIYNGTTYVPIRAVSQALNRRVAWEGTTNTVYIGVNNEPIIWQADLNHDGKDDKIVVETYMRDHGADLGATISIYDGASDLMLYSAEANVAHAGWDGFYLYNDGDNAYLLNWRPGMYSGEGDYIYEIFSFDDSSEKLVLDSGSYQFNAQDLSAELEGINEFIFYIQKVNNYLIRSYLLADTDNGELLCGTPDYPYTNPFVPAWLFSD